MSFTQRNLKSIMIAGVIGLAFFGTSLLTTAAQGEALEEGKFCIVATNRDDASITHTKGGPGCEELGIPSTTDPATPEPTQTLAFTKRCAYQPGVMGLNNTIRIFWESTSDEALTQSEISIKASTSGLGSALTSVTSFTHTQLANGSYETVVGTSSLNGRIGTASELELVLTVEGATEPLRVATNAGFIAGLGASCRPINEGA